MSERLRANAESRNILPSEVCLVVPATFDDGWAEQTDAAIDDSIAAEQEGR